MNTAALKTLSTATGPVVLAAGASMVMVALVTSARSSTGPQATGPTPGPTVTVTAPAVAVPSVEPSAGATRTLVPAGPVPALTTADRPVAAQQTSPGRIRPPQSPVPGGPPSSPAPGTGSHSPGCTRADLSLCLRLGIATSHALTTGGRR